MTDEDDIVETDIRSGIEVTMVSRRRRNGADEVSVFVWAFLVTLNAIAHVWEQTRMLWRRGSVWERVTRPWRALHRSH